MPGPAEKTSLQKLANKNRPFRWTAEVADHPVSNRFVQSQSLNYVQERSQTFNFDFIIPSPVISSHTIVRPFGRFCARQSLLVQLFDPTTAGKFARYNWPLDNSDLALCITNFGGELKTLALSLKVSSSNLLVACQEQVATFFLGFL